MPLPERKDKETYKDFIDRCMGDSVMNKEFPDAAQRRAVCERQSKPNAEAPEALELIGRMDIQAAAPDGTDGKPRLPQFSMIAYTGGAMEIGGWSYPVIIDLAGLTIPSQTQAIRFHHDPESGVGHTTSISIEAGKIVAVGIISRDTDAAREIVASAKNGFPWQASISASVQKREFVEEKQMASVNGTEVLGPVNILRKTTLGEMSFVDLGADANTSARIAARASQERQEQEKQTMEPNENEKKETGAPEAQGPVKAAATAQSIAEMTLAAKREDERQAKIRALVKAELGIQGADKDVIGKIGEEAVEAHWSPDQAELALIRGRRTPAPVERHTRTDGAIEPKVIEAGLAMAAKMSNVEKIYGAQVCQMASDTWPKGLSLGEFLMLASDRNGQRVSSTRNPEQLLRGAFGADRQIQAAGFSTTDISGILSNVANKFLTEGFNAVEQAWREITAIRPVRDFKVSYGYALNTGGPMEEVGPTGELKHGKLSEEAYTNQAKTFGKMFTITRTTIVNDDLDALSVLPRKIGRDGALALNKEFWTKFLANSAFFTAARANYIVNYPLSIDNLSLLVVAFKTLKDPDGNPTGAEPAILLVPPQLEPLALQLYKSTEMRDTTDSTKYPTANPHLNKYRPVVSRYLSNTSYSGSSALAWYLLANPTDLATIEVVFLNGQQAPTVESAAADFDVLGIQFRGFFDFGVSLQEYRAGCKSKGEA